MRPKPARSKPGDSSCLPPIRNISSKVYTNLVLTRSDARKNLSYENEQKIIEHLRRKLNRRNDNNSSASWADSQRNDPTTKYVHHDLSPEKTCTLTERVDSHIATMEKSSSIMSNGTRRPTYDSMNSQLILPSIVIDEHDSVFYEEQDTPAASDDVPRTISTPDWKSDYSSDVEDVFRSEEEFTESNESDIYSSLKSRNVQKIGGSETESKLSRMDLVHSVIMSNMHQNLSDLRKKVKIYLSHGGISTETEVKIFMTEVFPRISHLCRGLGLSFEVVDVGNKTARTEIAIHHLLDALKTSVGTAFMSFIPDVLDAESQVSPKYVPSDIMEKLLNIIQLEILATEASIFCQKANQLSISDNDEAEPNAQLDILAKKVKQCQGNRELIMNYYDLDSNAIPKEFVLRRRRQSGSGISSCEAVKLSIALKKYSKRLNADQFVRKWRDYALRTPSSREILTALNESNDPRNNCVWFYQMQSCKKGSLPSEFYSENSSEVSLKSTLKTRLSFNNLQTYQLVKKGETGTNWQKGKKSDLEESKRKQTEKLSFDIYNTISLQIKRAHETEEENSALVQHSDELIEQVKFMNEVNRNFVGREDILEEIKNYILSDGKRSPMVLYGEPGCGKTSVLCAAAQQCEMWIKNCTKLPSIGLQRHARPSVVAANIHKTQQPIIIFRSVGVNAETKSMRFLIHDITKQLEAVYKARRDEDNVTHQRTPSDLPSPYSLSKLMVFISRQRQTVLLFIDNLSAATDIKDRYSLSWLPKTLPKCFKVVLSFTCACEIDPSAFEVSSPKSFFEACLRQYRDELYLVAIPPLAFRETLQSIDFGRPTKGLDVLLFLLKLNERKVTKKQQMVIMRTANSCATPLALKLLVEIASNWKSYSSQEKIFNEMSGWGSNIRDFVCHFLSVVASKHNQNVFRAVTCFITCSKNGLTHQEVVDLVSMDKKATTLLHGRRVANPQVKKNSKSKREDKTTKAICSKRCDTVCEITRMWYLLYQDLKPFLMETLSDNVNTIKWRHAVFAEQIATMFMSEAKNLRHFHTFMMSYFSNTPIQCACGSIHDCGQPLQWSVGSRTTLNLRRLSESIFHARLCDDIEAIKREMIFDLNWLQAKLDATSIECLLTEIYGVLKMVSNDKDINLLVEALFVSRGVLCYDPRQLPSQLLGRLHDVIERDIPLAPQDPRRYPYTRLLLSQIRRSNRYFLMPSKTCLTSGKQIIFDPLHGSDDVITALVSCTDGQRIVTAAKDSTIKIWDIISRRVLRTIENVGRDVIAMCVCMGNYFVVTLHKNCRVNVWSFRQCSCVFSITCYAAEDRVLITTVSDGQLLATLSQKSMSMRVWDLDKLCFTREVSIAPEEGDFRDLTVARNSRGNNLFLGYLGYHEAIAVNAKRGKIVRTLKCKDGRITQVESSRDYYIIACRQKQMEVHELQHFYLYDSINYGLVRVIKACADDMIYDIFANRLGSHLIGLSLNVDGESEIVVWSMESDAHRHMVKNKGKFIAGTCIDLQYCITAGESENVVRVHNLAAQFDKHTHSRTQVKKKVDGIGKLFNMPDKDKYVVAQGIGGSPITIWNVARSKSRGEAVIIERGLLDKHDIVVVKDMLVVILSDRGIATIRNHSENVFETIYVYNLLLRKYERKLHPVQINMCPPEHYHVIGNDKLIGTSSDHLRLVVWSIVTGKILYTILPDFSCYQQKEKILHDKKKRRRPKRRHYSMVPSQQNDVKAKRTTWKKCRVTSEEQQQAIFEMVVSGDESVLLCSYYSRHIVVFDLKAQLHKHTLTDKHSILHLHKSILTTEGKHLLMTNYDSTSHYTYITLWDLELGNVSRRRRNEPKVCALTMTDDASRVVFATEDNYLKIWDPFRRSSHRSIPGYYGLEMANPPNDCCQSTTLYLTMAGKRAILYANSLSVWDLEAENVLMVFTPDVKFQCCTVALGGQVIVVGMRDSSNIITMRLKPSEGNRVTDKDIFGERDESSDDTSDDDIS